MKRRGFLIALSAIAGGGGAMAVLNSKPQTGSSEYGKSSVTGSRLPALFIGHGSPMNIVDKNRFTENFRKIGESLPKPKAILCISAHWETHGTKVLASDRPKQIYDFYGFPQELYEVSYKPEGAKGIADSVVPLVQGKGLKAETSSDWGLDHGTWSVLHHLYPAADVPTFQLSLDRGASLESHFEMARAISELRDQGVLVLGSGNIVHNLRAIDWDAEAPARPWAVKFDGMVCDALQGGGDRLAQLKKIFSDKEISMAHPSLDHLLPLVYAAGAGTPGGDANIIALGIQNGSVSMTSFSFA